MGRAVVGRARWAALAAGALGVVVVAFLTNGWMVGRWSPAPELTVEVNVPARILIGTREVGTGTTVGPFVGLVAGETTPLTILADGYSPMVRQIRMNPGERRVLSLELLRTPRPGSPVVADSSDGP